MIPCPGPSNATVMIFRNAIVGPQEGSGGSVMVFKNSSTGALESRTVSLLRYPKSCNFSAQARTSKQDAIWVPYLVPAR